MATSASRMPGVDAQGKAKVRWEAGAPDALSISDSPGHWNLAQPVLPLPSRETKKSFTAGMAAIPKTTMTIR